MKTHIISHGGCPDGFTSAWLLNRHYEGQDVVHHFAYDRLNSPKEIEPGDRVLIADWSYPRQVLLDLSETTYVTLLDHHKTAEADLEGLDCPGLDIIFDMNKSGAMLVWDWIGQPDGAEALVYYVQDYDLWTKEKPDTEEINAIVQSTPMKFEDWDNLAYDLAFNRKDVVREGTAVRRYQRKIIDAAKKDARRMNIGGYSVWVTQAPYALGSMIAGELAEEYPDDAFAAYYIALPGEFQFGLRSRNDDGPGFDVSEVAQIFGGGGHHNASGFKIKWSESMDPLQVLLDVQS